MQAIVATSWVVDADGGRTQLLTNELIIRNQTTPSTWTVTDITGQAVARFASSPNMVLVAVECDAATLAFIDADNRFRTLYDDNTRLASRVLTNTQFNQLKNFFTTRLGWTNAQIDAALGASVGGRTVAQLVTALINYMRSA